MSLGVLRETDADVLDVRPVEAVLPAQRRDAVQRGMAELADLAGLEMLAGWDLRVTMPGEGASARVTVCAVRSTTQSPMGYLAAGSGLS